MKRKARAKTTKALGDSGEKQAVDYLLNKDFKILERNYRYKRFEIDIIALDTVNDELVFVEVKKRSSAKFGHPSLAVNSKKIANLQVAANVYTQRKRLNKSFRFDIISLLPNKIEHFENVTIDL